MKKSFLLSSILTLSFGLSVLISPAQLCFKPHQDYVAGSQPYVLTSSDFNGDGKKDLAVANYSDNNISVYLNNGSGGFGTPSTIGTGNGPFAITSADFNGDSKQDLAVANYSDGNVAIYLGNGSGGFGLPSTLALNGESPYFIIAADFNADGDADLAVSYEWGGNVSILIGNGSGGFAAYQDYSIGHSNNYSVGGADVNKDGKIDLLISCRNNGVVTIMLGNGDGTFQSPTDWTAGSNPVFVSVADMNADGNKDLAVSGENGNVYVGMGNGDGTFQVASSLTTQSNYSNIIADLNGDGNLDIAAPNYNGSEITIFKGDGNGNFASGWSFETGSQPYMIVADDFDADGKTDLATANYDDYTVSVLLNTNAPSIAINASATTLCAGESLVLSGSGGDGVGANVVAYYDIHSGDLTGMNGGLQCGTPGNYYASSGTSPGFTWTSTEPAGAQIQNIEIRYNLGQNEYGYGNWWWPVYPYFNGNGQSYEYDWYFWSCGTRDNIKTMYPSTGQYNIGGSNSVQLSNPWSGQHIGLCENSGWPSDVYARVKVTYSVPYAWSGGVQNNTSFVPPAGTTTTYTVVGSNQDGCVNTSQVSISVNDVIGTSFALSDATCLCNGVAVATVTGGTAPFTYAWNGGNTTSSRSALCAGTYTLTSTDAVGCTNVDYATISATPSMSLVPSSTDVSCIANGTADVTVTGGTAPYVYSWSNGATTSSITGLTAGTYTLTATDSYSIACSNMTTVTIGNSPLFSISTIKTNATCTASCNGTATASVSGGGTAPYTYAWSPSGGTTSVATGLCGSAGGTTYTITVTDNNGCSRMATTIIGLTPASVAFTNTPASCTSACNGSSVASGMGGTSPYTYSWTTGSTNASATGLCGGSTYTVTVTDAGGCAFAASTTIDNANQVYIDTYDYTAASCDKVCNGALTVYALDGTMPYTYSWSNGNTTMTATGLCADTDYTVTVTDANGCSTQETNNVWADNNFYIDWINTDDASCGSVCNGQATVYAYDGIGSYTYSWSNGQSAMTATGLCGSANGTTYSVTITDGVGCQVSDSTDAIIYFQSPIGFDYWSNDAACVSACNGVANIYDVWNGQAPYTYLWADGNTTNEATGLCGSANGTFYKVTITDSLGCSMTDSTYIGIWLEDLVDFSVSTWDATCSAACDGEAMIYSWDIWDGTSPYTYSWSNGSTTNDATGLCVGNHNSMVTVTDANGCSRTQDVYINDANNGVYVDWIDTYNTFCNAVCTGSAQAWVDGGNAPYTFLWSTGATTDNITGLCAGDYTFTVTDVNGCSDWDVITINTNSDITFNPLSWYAEDATCDQVCNGSLSVVNVQNGSTPYTYLWSNGATNAVAMGLCGSGNGITYSVTVTDANGCTQSASRTIYADNDMWINTWSYSEYASCTGVCDGMDSAVVYSGVAPYSYQWSNGTSAQVATGLCGDDLNGITYTITVTDSIGCKTWEDVTIYTNDPPDVSVATTNVFCNSVCNGTAYASVVDGTAPYTYNWSNGATTAAVSNLCAGTYILNVKDAKGCMGSATFNILALNANMTVAITNTGASCNGVCDGTAAATVAGGTYPLAYQWLPSGGSADNAAGLCAGTYTLNVTDANGCMKSTKTTIVQPVAMVTNVTVTNSTSCVAGNGTATANVAGGSAPYYFAWTPTGQITQTAVVLADGTYSVTVTDSKGCTATGSGVVTCTSGINELSAENMFSVSPNPTNGYFVVTALNNTGIDGIVLDNVLGQSVYSVTIDKHQMSKGVDITAQPAGVYFLRITSGGTVYSQKVVKQ